MNVGLQRGPVRPAVSSAAIAAPRLQLPRAALIFIVGFTSLSECGNNEHLLSLTTFAALDAASAFQELHPGVLDELKQLSRKSAPRFHDVEFQRNKRRVATTGAAVSRGWYLPVDTWIAGTTAPEEVLAANPFDDEVRDSLLIVKQASLSLQHCKFSLSSVFVVTCTLSAHCCWAATMTLL